MTLENLIWKFPFLKFTSHNEWLKFLNEKMFKLFFLEQQEQIVKEEIAILEFYTEFDRYTDQSLILLASLILILGYLV